MLSRTKSEAVVVWAPPKILSTLLIARPASRPMIASTTRISKSVKARRLFDARIRGSVWKGTERKVEGILELKLEIR